MVVYLRPYVRIVYICRYLLKVAELFEKLRKVESRVSSDEDLKLTELLRYYMLNIEAAKVRAPPKQGLVMQVYSLG